MAVRVYVTATDRQGHVHATKIVEGSSFQDTFEGRGRVYAQLKDEYREPDGWPPYIFTRTESF